MTEPTVRCERCDKPYASDEAGCPNCRSIRRTNAVIGTTMIMLVILVVIGWIGAGIMM